jgi:hypothetical protein
MDIQEFVGKIAEQHTNLIKVIELQNNSIQTLNQRINSLMAVQLILFSFLTELNPHERQKIARHLRAMLDNPNIASSSYLAAQLRELLEMCDDNKTHTAHSKNLPDWFKGVVQGGAPDFPHKDKL